MIPVLQKRRTTVVGEDIDYGSFGIDDKNIVHIINILRNDIYKDKVKTVLREYSANAYDAHVEAGKADLPFVVRLPTHLDPTLSIRDFGKGLTNEEIFDIYCKYGASTKRESNDYIGMLGIGSKSAFAYGDSFVIVSYKDGVKTSYSAFLDKSGVGKIAKLAEEPTTEENGVEIVVAVNVNDANRFLDLAINEVYTFYKVPPKIYLADSTEELKPCSDLAHVDRRGKDWYTSSDSSNAPMRGNFVIMGNIGYPLNYSSIKNLSLKHERLLQTEVLRLEFGLGELTVAANREDLQYTDKTEKAIKQKLNKVLLEVEEEMTARLGHCSLLWDAILCARNYRDDVLAPIAVPNPMWNGFSLKNYSFPIGGVRERQVWTINSNTDKITGVRKVLGVNSHSKEIVANRAVNKNSTTGKVSIVDDSMSIFPEARAIVAVRGRDKITKIKQRIATIAAEHPVSSVVVITFQRNSTYKAFLAKKPLMKVLDLHTVTPSEVSFEKVEKTKSTALRGYDLFRYSPHLQHWEDTTPTKDIKGYIFTSVVAKRFYLGSKSFSSQMCHNDDIFSEIIAKKKLKFIGILSKDIKRVPSDWVSIDDFFKELLKTYNITKEKLEQRLAVSTQVPTLISSILQVIPRNENKLFDQLGEQINIANSSLVSEIEDSKLVRAYLGVEDTPKENSALEDAVEAIIKRYPLLADEYTFRVHLRDYITGKVTYHSKLISDLTDYINGMELLYKKKEQ